MGVSGKIRGCAHALSPCPVLACARRAACAAGVVPRTRADRSRSPTTGAEPEPAAAVDRGPHVGPPSRASPAGPGSTRRGGVADANVNECRLICTVLVARACFGVSSLLPKNDMHEQTGKPWRHGVYSCIAVCMFLCKLDRVMHSEFYLVVL